MTGQEVASGGPAVVRVGGPSDAGKTTLVERLVDAFAEELTIGTVKSIHHAIEPDTPGTDTHRHRTAGADSVVGITPTLTFEISTITDSAGSDRSAGTDPDDAKRAALDTTVRRFAARGYDLVLLEGFSGTDVPTIRLGGHDREIAGEVIATGDDDFEDVVAAVRAVAARD